MPPSLQKNRVRPDPVSCQSCRSKKLKCNRVQPCSNCAARGIPCKFLVQPQRETAVLDTTRSNAELLERIRRLEAMIQRSSPVQSSPRYVLEDAFSGPTQVVTPSSGTILASDVHKVRDEDSETLENVGTREDAVVRHAHYPLSKALSLWRIFLT